MKKGRFLWSAHRITERQKAGKARSIKGKQLKNSRSTDSKKQEEQASFQSVSPRDFANFRGKKFIQDFSRCCPIRAASFLLKYAHRMRILRDGATG